MAVKRSSNGSLELGGVTLSEVVRDPRIGTPSYVYDLDGIASEARELIAAFEGTRHLVAYAVKANSAGEVVRTLLAEGCGADVVSGGELTLALRAGVAPRRILFSGVAKADDELDLAVSAGGDGVGAIQIESVEEIARVAARAAASGRKARVSLRMNPGVDAEDLDTHSYIATGHDEAKFGVPLSSLAAATAAVASFSDAVELVGVGAHVGSQFTKLDPYLASARAVFEVAKELRQRFAIAYVDTGGGFGIDYGDGREAKPADFIRATRALQRELGVDDLALYCEPGRSLVGAHGVLVARVVQRKEALGAAPARRWTMIDAGMNDLLRPALYQARHRVVSLFLAPGATTEPSRVVGPVCESSDDFGVHDLPAGDGVREVAILDAGAYGYSMASRYNGRALPAEVFLRGGAAVRIRPRKAVSDWVEDRLDG